jgi:hypothetical protein
MKNAQLETTPLPHRSETPALRLVGAPTARHDFLVPNPRPDLSEPVAAVAGSARRNAFDPDSMFWNPGDAA